MSRLWKLIPAITVVAALVLPGAARADFGFQPGSLEVRAHNRDGSIATQASSHPYSFTVNFSMSTLENGESIGGAPRDYIAQLPPGLVANPEAVPRCPRASLVGLQSFCPPETQIGVAAITVVGVSEIKTPVYNIIPPPGVAAEIGFTALHDLYPLDASLAVDRGYGADSSDFNIAQPTSAVKETIWGVPADPGHDSERGSFNGSGGNGAPVPANAPLKPFLTFPASCQEAPEVTMKADSVLLPGVYAEETAPFTDSSGLPTPLTGCQSVPFSPAVSAIPTTRSASSPSGLDFELKLPNQGLLGPGAVAETEPRKTVVALPPGMTVNPSFAEGVGVCSEAQYQAEQIGTPAGGGCPESSKLGSVTSTSPLLDEPIEGSLYQAAPYENPFHTLVALYLVARAPERGVLVKQAGRVDLDPATGQLTTTFEGLPPVPYSSFKLHFREGARAPLATPATCGQFSSQAQLTPFSAGGDGEAAMKSATFQITSGSEGSPCPSGGTPSFHPGLVAGSINNAAGSYSPFNVRLTRNDSEQEITHFSIKLPPGITGKLAGIPFCPEADIAAAKAREGQPHGGQEELDSPSCPAASEIGHTLVGSGVGPSLTYVPGKIYLAGSYNGAPLSIVAITAAKAGPFDLGTVVVRQALRINPETAEVFIDATGSDPIPHIIDGIPVHLRDIRAYVDRPDFALNPTSCAATSTASTVLGSGTDFTSEADDQPVTVATRFQAADCASLPYKPAIQLKLKGGTRRGGNPAFTAILRPRPGDANSKEISVALPHSEFLDQAHIKTICTRVQFKAGAGNGAECPAASVYGHVKAWTPLLSEPLEGPIFLRSSEHPLPDLVLALHGLVDFTAVGRIDSVNGGIRNTFEAVPDAPISKVEVSLPGGKKSLLENSTNICVGKHNATVEFGAQSGKEAEGKVALKPQCKGKAKKKASKKSG